MAELPIRIGRRQAFFTMVNGKGKEVELIAIVPREARFVEAGFRQLHELLESLQHFVLIAPAGRMDAPYGFHFCQGFKRIVIAHGLLGMPQLSHFLFH